VGSWLLVYGGEAMLLDILLGLTIKDARKDEEVRFASFNSGK
jgi:hypothetical protein